ncbi:MAG: ferritin-like domain-containing protein [Ilumatobacteraceae bacterium]
MTTIDGRGLRELVTESQDLQTDAMRGLPSRLSDARDYANESGNRRPDPEQLARFNDARAEAAAKIRVETGANRGGRLAGGALFGAALAAVIGSRASADEALDVQMLQTASSLERLAVNTYTAALTLPFIAGGNATIVAFATETMAQHDEHRKAFIAMTESMGATGQDEPNPVFSAIVASAMPGLVAPIDVVNLAATLEKVATDTYLKDLTMFEGTEPKALMGSVMGVEAQHLAVLRAVAALLTGGGEALIVIPTDLAALPAAAGSVAYPEPFETFTEDMIAQPESGATT